MAMDYAKCAKEIFDTVGGRSNLVSAAHCATRLRLVTVDNSKIDMKKLENIDGVKGVFSNNGQLQLIIGTGTVNKVYDEFLKVSGMTAATKEEVKAAAAAKQPVFKRMIKALGDVFVPILPAIVASGLMMGLVEALGKAMPAFAGSDWYGILDLFSNTAFTFLPILIAVSAARVFGGNIFLGAVIGMIMIHPNLINAWSVASMDAADIPVWHLFGFSIRQVGYQGHVIPVIIAVWIMCKLENWLHKHVPEMIDLFVTPLCTVLITGFLTIGLIGPVFSTAETYVLEFASWIITVGHGIGAMIMGAIYPLTVVCGIHHMYNVIEAGMLASDGLNIWMPIASAANFAQGAACLAVGLKARNYKTKSISIPSALSAALGITEPAIFGVNLRFMKPLVCGMAGGAVGALLGSIFHIGATSYGVTGIPGFLTTLDYSAQYAIMLAVSFAVSFVLTWFTWKEDPEDAKVTAAKTDDAPAAEPTATEETAEEVTVDGTAKKLYAPIQGTIVPRNEIPDDTFAAGVLGDGVGIDPEEGVVVAPFDGEISSVTDTKHAIGITGPADMEVLIHVGVDTVNMKGDGFELLVEEGQKVKAGQKLMTFDIAKIKAAGYSPVAAVLLTNSDDYPEFKVVKTGKTQRLEEVFTV
ncbi:pTS system sucrose-specific EIIBCA component [Blautia sp. CAG:237]|jgi:sucrose-specific phosphotransferase system IIBC component|nr:PTS transporter subunit IIBCA [Blautia sp. CAG:237]CDB77686.1 pTS system sucrose-specific EIIBCA component [Blautia sp. CAG:237]